MNTDEDVLTQAAEWRARGMGVALATVVRTWGSAPRRAGSHMAVNEEGGFCGSVSGGCVEGAVVTAALEVIGSGETRNLSYGVTNEMAWEVGLACGGKVAIHVERVAPGALTDLVHALAEKRPVVRATRLDGGGNTLLFPLEGGAENSMAWPMEAARLALLDDLPVTETTDAGEVFLRPYNPPVRLVVVGAVHIAGPLVQMAAVAGMDVIVVDPRTDFATAERFPGVELVDAWPQVALDGIRPDHRTAVVTLTHDAKLDDPALRAALSSRAFYVGALGSRGTHGKRLERLRAQGVRDDDLARISAPVGLEIGARTPAEIAVAVLAEIIAHLNRVGSR